MKVLVFHKHCIFQTQFLYVLYYNLWYCLLSVFPRLEAFPCFGLFYLVTTGDAKELLLAIHSGIYSWEYSGDHTVCWGIQHRLQHKCTTYCAINILAKGLKLLCGHGVDAEVLKYFKQGANSYPSDHWRARM